MTKLSKNDYKVLLIALNNFVNNDYRYQFSASQLKKIEKLQKKLNDKIK